MSKNVKKTFKGNAIEKLQILLDDMLLPKYQQKLAHKAVCKKFNSENMYRPCSDG